MNLYKKLIPIAFITILSIYPANNQAFSANSLGYKIDTSYSPKEIILISTNKTDEKNKENKKIISDGAQNFVQSMAQRALDFLESNETDKKEKAKKFENLLEDNFDMKTIGRFALGKYWRSSTKEEKKQYLELFQEMIVNVYSQRLSEYKGQKLETIGSRMTNKRDTLVMSIIKSNDGSPDIKVDWMVRYKNGKYKIIDVKVEGVSMAITQRQDFSSVIQRGGGKVSVLINHLKKINESTL